MVVQGFTYSTTWYIEKLENMGLYVPLLLANLNGL